MRQYGRGAFSLERFAADELPNVFIKAAELFLYRHERARILYSRVNLQPVANDSRIAKKFRNPLLAIPRHLFRIEVIERVSIVPALAQNRLPTQTGLRAFEN